MDDDAQREPGDGATGTGAGTARDAAAGGEGRRVMESNERRCHHGQLNPPCPLCLAEDSDPRTQAIADRYSYFYDGQNAAKALCDIIEYLEGERNRFFNAVEQIATGDWETFHITGADEKNVVCEGGDRFAHERTLAEIVRIARSALFCPKDRKCRRLGWRPGA